MCIVNMCENILTETLEGKIPLNVLLQFLLNPSSEDRLLDTQYLQCDFVSYFLNYIHEIQQINKDKCNNLPTNTAAKSSPQCNNHITPKYNKKGSVLINTTPKNTSRNVDDSYVSPISPLYSASNRVTSKLSLGDFIINTPKVSNKKNFTRRIKPTTLNFNNSNSEFINNSFSFNGVSDNTDGKRSVLVEECLKIVSTHKNPAFDLSSLKSLTINNQSEIVPCLEMVSCKDQLDKLIMIYNHLLSNNYIRNFISELHFLITVLLSKEYSDDFDNTSLFKTFHNRIYFVTNLLCSYNSILGLLDRVTLRLLTENKRLSNFVTLKPVEFKCNIENIEQDTCNENVCFISDTDNRSNFPNDVSFHAFRKQRDLFYEILRIWEMNHLKEEWNFGIALGGKIKALLYMHADAANMVHLARLFRAQLLMNTCGTNNDDLSFISSISNVNAEKLQRLKNRIVSKHANNGIHSPPSFSGYEEFYRDFILVGAHYIFNRHLNDALICNIIELNDTKFDCVDLDGTESVVNQSTKTLYTKCLKSLRILAKFLGFLDALPYMPLIQVHNVVTCCVQARSTTQPNINLLLIADKMCISGSLILTVPWLTEYLAMLDYTSLRLPYFEAILYRLFGLYCSNIKIPLQNLLFIKINLGWLFELPQFPENLYYDWLKRSASNDSLIINSTLDALDIIDHTIIYMCCPYLNEIKQLLSNDAVNINNTVRHITPLSSIQPMQKRLQLQLEEAFFNGQAVSVRKTVEFISERIASACVKHICNEIVPNFRKEARCEFRSLLDEPLSIDKVAANQLRKLCDVIDVNVRTMVGNRVDAAMDVLLATDVLSQTKNVCVNIATQTCLERVQQWINSHINTGFFIKDFEADLKRKLEIKQRKPIFLLPTFGNHSEHNERALSGSQCIENIRSLSWKLLEDANTVTKQSICNVMDSVYLSIHERCDLNEPILILICRMLVEVIFLLLAHRPDLLNNKIEKKIFNIWHQCQEDLFRTFISPRNIVILTQSCNQQFTLHKFCTFVNSLIEEHLLTTDAIELQMDTIRQHGLSRDMMQFLYNYLNSIASSQTTDRED